MAPQCPLLITGLQLAVAATDERKSRSTTNPLWTLRKRGDTSMSLLITQILVYLCGTFAFGILVGWLAKQLRVRHIAGQNHDIWQERLRRQRQELEAVQRAARKNTAQIRESQDQLTAATD